jgi:hypothetical protein
MKKPSKPRKPRLDVETVRLLRSKELEVVVGGGATTATTCDAGMSYGKTTTI